MANTAPLTPTYHGYISDTMDALKLFEACLSGDLAHVPRRPHDRERSGLIRSGNIFIYEEQSSGIKRWTDGITWSPSRILGNFLVYRELDQAFAPGEKKRALKKPVGKRLSTGGISKPSTTQSSVSPSHHRLSISSAISDATPSSFPNGSPREEQKDPSRELVGSLTDSYDFKEGGLVKKTISIKHRGISHHLVSYYTIEDAKNNRLVRPCCDPALNNVHIREELFFNNQFRTAITEYDYRGPDGKTYIASAGYMAIPHSIEGFPQPLASYPAPNFEAFAQEQGNMPGFGGFSASPAYEAAPPFGTQGQPSSYDYTQYSYQGQPDPNYFIQNQMAHVMYEDRSLGQ